MGLSADCSARLAGKRSKGTALLETDEIVFRGSFRAVVPLKSIESVQARDGSLVINYPGGPLTLELGANAEKWREKIQNPKGLLDKLGVKAGQKVAIMGIRDAEFLRDVQLRTGPAAVALDGAEFDVIFLGLESKQELDKLGHAREHIRGGGMIWTVWPKGRAEFKEDDIRTAARKLKLVDVKVVKFSETLSALKLVIPVHSRGNRR